MNAFKESGYRVLPPSTQEPAMALNVKVLEGWASFKLDGMGAIRKSSNTIAIQTTDQVKPLIIKDTFEKKMYIDMLPGAHTIYDPYVQSLDVLKSKLKEQIKSNFFTENQIASVQ